MLNLFKLKEKSINSYTKREKLNNTKTTSNYKSPKHFPSSIREWNNSIFAFNKNSMKLIPHTTNVVIKLIKDYFNLYNKRLEQKMRTRKLFLRLRRVSSNKFYVSNGGMKHTNNRVSINLFIFNRQKTNHLLTLRKWFLKNMFISKVNNTNGVTNISERIKCINNKGIKNFILLNKNKFLLIKTLSILKNNKNIVNTLVGKSISNYTENFYKDLINRSMIKIRMYFYYKQLIYLNKSRINYTYLQYLKEYLEDIYKKNVEFNIINLKKFYLNSDILSESMSLKLTRNRKKMLAYLNALRNKVFTKKKGIFSIKKYSNGNVINSKKNYVAGNPQLHDHVISSLKYRHITGFRLEAKGRLTKRFAASRSLSKFKYKGNLLNIDSSFKGLSSVLLKGNLKSNTQYSVIKSKSRIGSFGIKGWVSGN